jgi:predicted phosphodiesterase
MTLDETRLDLRYPVVVVSDLHLAHPASHLREPSGFLPLAEGACTVVFNGDTMEHNSVIRRQQAIEFARELAEAIILRGARPIFLAGNHDCRISSAPALALLSRGAFITHGDALHPLLAPWSKEAGSLRRERERLVGAGLPEGDHDAEQVLLKRMAAVASLYDSGRKAGIRAKFDMVGRFARDPLRVARAFRFWSSVPALADRFRARHCPDAGLFLIGHTHRPGIWRRSGYILVNSGSYQPLSYPLVTRFEADGRVLVRRARRHRPSGWRLAETVLEHRLNPRGTGLASPGARTVH